MSVFYDLNKTPRNILNQAIVRAIISENNGALFDPSDLSTLYQDVAGTIPVTAVEQPVGKMLDKSGNGYHATQSITASRPTLSARYNLLTKTEDFSDAVWIKSETTVSNNKIIPSTASSSHYAYQQSALTIPAGAIVSFDTNLKHGGYGFVRLQLESSAGLVFAACRYNLSTGAIVQSDKDVALNGATLVASRIAQYPDGFFRCHLECVIPTTTTVRANVRIVTSDSNFSFSGNGVSGVHSMAADLRIGTTPGQYQRVNTETDYDTDERYFKKYLRFDGIDDYLVLPYMGLYVGGSASAILCVDDRTQSVNARVLSESSSTTSSQYTIRNLTSGGIDSYIADDAGAAFVDSPNTKGIESKNYIISVIDSGSDIKRYRNSVYENVQSYSRAGKTFTADKTTIGALNTMGAVVAYTAMNLYGLIITKSALTDAQRIKCERYAASKAGVQL